ncbi:MAG: hypothetical protein WDM76_11530 [Limisphaerales bacterium]
MATNSGVKGISIGGVEPTIASVNKGDYPYKRTLHLYTNKTKETPATLEFIKFIQSAAGQKVLTEMGYVPNP